MDLSAIRTCVETELELLGEQTPTMLDRTLKPTSNDATSEPARHHDRCTALAKYLLERLKSREDLRVKQVSVNTGSGDKSNKDLYFHVEFNDGSTSKLTFEVRTGLGWYLGVQRVVNATTKERPSLTPEMTLILHALAVQSGSESRDFARQLLGPYLRGQAAELLRQIETDTDLATAMTLHGVFPDDLSKAYESLLPTGNDVIDVTTADVSSPLGLGAGDGAES